MTYLPISLQKVNLYLPTVRSRSRLATFLAWCTHEEEKHHIGWVGVSIMSMTAFFFPLTMAAILLNGAKFGLIVIAMIPLTGVVVVNLAALPTRYTIPALCIGIFLDLFVSGISFL